MRGRCGPMPLRARELAALKPDFNVAVGPRRPRPQWLRLPYPPRMFGAERLRDRALPLAAGRERNGLCDLGGEHDIKRLELLHEAVSGASPIANLMQASDPSLLPRRRDLQAAAARMGIELLAIEVGAAGAYAEAFMAMRAAGARGVAFSSDPQFYRDAGQLAALALGARLPTIASGARWPSAAVCRATRRPVGYSASGADRRAHPQRECTCRPSKEHRPSASCFQFKSIKALGLTIRLSSSPRRRGDRIAIFAALHESALGPSRHFAAPRNLVVIGA